MTVGGVCSVRPMLGGEMTMNVMRDCFEVIGADAMLTCTVLIRVLLMRSLVV